MIAFSHIKHSVTMHGVTVKLQPLSFKLLERLADTPYVSVSIEEIEQAVWGNVTVSPETLKQRIFVLRKSLTDGGLKSISIQSVRGEGYRLIVEQQANTPKLPKPKKRVVAALALLLAFAGSITYNLYTQPKYAPVNNRMVLWTSVSSQDMSPDAASIYEAWRSLLTSENNGRGLQLIFSDRQEGTPLSVQARKSRAAIISYFELVLDCGEPAIRLHIIEPITATTLRSDIISYDTKAEGLQVMRAQRDGVLALLGSGKLYLNAEQRKNARSPIWQELRRLANSS